MPASPTLVRRQFAALQTEYPMPNDKSNAKSADRRNISNQSGQGSQDAVRHEKDALHHKFHKGPQPSGRDEKNDQQAQARAQQDSIDMQQIEGQQPEIPKVGSRDAPGG
jgi:hypothetical protein